MTASWLLYACCTLFRALLLSHQLLVINLDIIKDKLFFCLRYKDKLIRGTLGLAMNNLKQKCVICVDKLNN